MQGGYRAHEPVRLRSRLVADSVIRPLESTVLMPMVVVLCIYAGVRVPSAAYVCGGDKRDENGDGMCFPFGVTRHAYG